MGMITAFGGGEQVEVTLDGGQTWQPATIYKALPKRLYQICLSSGGYQYVNEAAVRRPAPADAPVGG
jgi:hypothetical protein